MHLKGKRIIVTGGSGFLGWHVVQQLKAKEVGEIHVPRSVNCDLTDRILVRKLYAEFKPSMVIHLAARVGGIGANQANPATYFHDNLVMGVNILDEGVRAGVEKIVVAGTICAYPKFAPIPFKEDDLWNGFPEETNAPYGIAKKALLVMSQAYRAQYGFNSCVVFPVNLYGPRDNFDLASSHVIPAMIRKFVEAHLSGNQTVELWGDGTPTREFLYVEDCAAGIIMAAENYESSDPVNLGAGFEISIYDLASKIATLVGYKGNILWDTTKPNGQPRRILDVTRAKQRFGFVATTAFEEGLKKTIDWFQLNRIVGAT